MSTTTTSNDLPPLEMYRAPTFFVYRKVAAVAKVPMSLNNSTYLEAVGQRERDFHPFSWAWAVAKAIHMYARPLHLVQSSDVGIIAHELIMAHRVVFGAHSKKHKLHNEVQTIIGHLRSHLEREMFEDAHLPVRAKLAEADKVVNPVLNSPAAVGTSLGSLAIESNAVNLEDPFGSPSGPKTPANSTKSNFFLRSSLREPSVEKPNASVGAILTPPKTPANKRVRAEIDFDGSPDFTYKRPKLTNDDNGINANSAMLKGIIEKLDWVVSSHGKLLFEHRKLSDACEALKEDHEKLKRKQNATCIRLRVVGDRGMVDVEGENA